MKRLPSLFAAGVAACAAFAAPFALAQDASGLINLTRNVAGAIGLGAALLLPSDAGAPSVVADDQLQPDQ